MCGHESGPTGSGSCPRPASGPKSRQVQLPGEACPPTKTPTAGLTSGQRPGDPARAEALALRSGSAWPSSRSTTDHRLAKVRKLYRHGLESPPRIKPHGQDASAAGGQPLPTGALAVNDDARSVRCQLHGGRCTRSTGQPTFSRRYSATCRPLPSGCSRDSSWQSQAQTVTAAGPAGSFVTMLIAGPSPCPGLDQSGMWPEAAFAARVEGLPR